MKISVVICYVDEPWVFEAIDSVEAQTHTDWECILSPDGRRSLRSNLTLAVLSRIAGDKRFRLIKHQHRLGSVGNKQTACRFARGEWLAILDADDRWHPTKLADQIEAIRENSNLVAVGTGFNLIDENGNYIGTRRVPTSHSAIVSSMLSMGIFPPHSSSLFRRSTFNAIGGYRQGFPVSEDFDLWLRMSESGPITCVPKKLTCLRKRHGSVSSTGEKNLCGTYTLVALLLYLSGDIQSPCPKPLARWAGHMTPSYSFQRVVRWFLPRLLWIFWILKGYRKR